MVEHTHCIYHLTMMLTNSINLVASFPKSVLKYSLIHAYLHPHPPAMACLCACIRCGHVSLAVRLSSSSSPSGRAGGSPPITRPRGTAPTHCLDRTHCRQSIIQRASLHTTSRRWGNRKINGNKETVGLVQPKSRLIIYTDGWIQVTAFISYSFSLSNPY